jgi:hypothetical protein
MSSRRYAVRLPIIPKPAAGTATVFITDDDFSGPIIRSDGELDLLCGRCFHILGKAMHPGQLENLVLRCAPCGAHNVVVSIPALENLVEQVQSATGVGQKLADLKDVLTLAQKEGSAPEVVAERAVQAAPELSTIRDLLIPKTPGDFYSLLALVIAFVTFLQSMKSGRPAPTTVVNNFFGGVRRKDPCPCQSGKKFRNCHGK